MSTMLANACRAHADGLRFVAAPSALFLAAVAIIGALDIDHRVANWLFDPDTRGFPLRDSLWADRIAHEGGRALVLATLVSALLVWLLSWRAVPTSHRKT